VQYRVAKITPTKVGQFVTLWKRVGRGPIQPFELNDPVDMFVVSTRSGPHPGYFVDMSEGRAVDLVRVKALLATGVSESKVQIYGNQFAVAQARGDFRAAFTGWGLCSSTLGGRFSSFCGSGPQRAFQRQTRPGVHGIW
jgi:hypothetical protein